MKMLSTLIRTAVARNVWSINSVLRKRTTTTSYSRQSVMLMHALSSEDVFAGRFCNNVWSDDEETGIENHGVVIMRIAEWLECSYADACDVLNLVPEIKAAHLDSVDDYVNFLKRSGITGTLLCENPWMLTTSVSTLRPKLHLLAKHGFDSNTAPYLKLGRRTLKKFLSKPSVKIGDRIELLARTLGCGNGEVVLLLEGQCRGLLTMDFDKLCRLLQLLLDYGIAPADIKQDFWIFRINEVLIKLRLNRAKEAGIEPLKPWMLRCPEIKFQEIINRTHRKAVIMSNSLNKIDILAKCLRCSVDDAERLVERYPVLRSLSLFKMEKAFEFLYSRGITAKQIMSYPLVLYRRLDLIEMRLTEMQKLGISQPQLHVACYPLHRYKKALEKNRSLLWRL